MPVLGAYMACSRQFFEKNRSGILLIAYTIGYAAYLALGGLLFLVVEGPQEELELKNIESVKSNVMMKFPMLQGAAVDELYEQLKANGVKGIEVGNTSPKWTYGNSILFSVTLLTTIGYGHLAPLSRLGKVITLFYSGIGIPISLLLLALYVDRMMSQSEHYKGSLFRRLGGYVRPTTIRIIHYSTTMTFILVSCFIVPACVFCWLEVKWTYLDAIYFCFISLTTIGLGDFVPGLIQKHPYVDLYRFGAALYLICGVTTMMFMMALTADFVHNYKKDYYEMLPLVMPSEKDSSIRKQHSYGTISDTDKNDNIMQP